MTQYICVGKFDDLPSHTLIEVVQENPLNNDFAYYREKYTNLGCFTVLYLADFDGVKHGASDGRGGLGFDEIQWDLVSPFYANGFFDCFQSIKSGISDYIFKIGNDEAITKVKAQFQKNKIDFYLNPTIYKEYLQAHIKEQQIKKLNKQIDEIYINKIIKEFNLLEDDWSHKFEMLKYDEIHTWYIYNQFSFSLIGRIIGKDDSAHLNFSNEVIKKNWNAFKKFRDYVYIDCDSCKSKNSLKATLDTDSTKPNGLTPVTSVNLLCNRCNYHRTIKTKFYLEKIIPIKESNYVAFSLKLKSLLDDVIKQYG